MMGHNICFKGILWEIIPFTPSYLEHDVKDIIEGLLMDDLFSFCP